MKIGQVVGAAGRRIVVVRDRRVQVLKAGAPERTLDVVAALAEGESLSDRLELLVRQWGIESEFDEQHVLAGSSPWRILTPIDPPEVWACGVTYQRQAAEHDDDIRRRTARTESLYDYVYRNERVEVFFKGFSRTMSAHGSPVQLRADARQTLPESELVLVLGPHGRIVGFTLGNDLTAWDIERECPLYLNQAKIWDGSGSLGPFLFPSSDLDDPYACEFGCRVIRNGELIMESHGSARGMKRSLEELCHFLRFNNAVPAGTVLFTGTACVIPHDFTLEDGDIVEVSEASIGRLVNPVIRAAAPEVNYPRRLAGEVS